jgi:hypothetical protein
VRSSAWSPTAQGCDCCHFSSAAWLEVKGSPWTSSSGQSSLVAPVGASSDIGNNFYLLISTLGRKCEGYTAHHLINKNNNLNALRNDLSRFAKYQLVEGSFHQVRLVQSRP